MPQLSPERRHLRATKARLTQLGSDTSDVDAAIKAARAEAYITRLVADAPPLSSAQRDRLAALLRPMPKDGAA